MIGENPNYIIFRINYLLIIQQSIRYFLLTYVLKFKVPDLFGIQIDWPTQGALSCFNWVDYFGSFSAIDIRTYDLFGWKLVLV